MDANTVDQAFAALEDFVHRYDREGLELEAHAAFRTLREAVQLDEATMVRFYLRSEANARAQVPKSIGTETDVEMIRDLYAKGMTLGFLVGLFAAQVEGSG